MRRCFLSQLLDGFAGLLETFNKRPAVWMPVWLLP